jgi:hypothetical protein
LTLLVSALLIAPASAHADFTEIPTYDFTGEPSCVAPTGAPGEVAIGSTSGARFLQATRTGFTQTAEVKAGEGFTCGAVVSRPNGAGVIAGTQYYGDSVVAVVRDPGGAWSAPVHVASREGWTPDTVVGDVSERGDVVVAWTEERSRPEPQIRVRIAQRLAGGEFGPPKVVFASNGMSYPRSVDAAVTSTGEAVVTWTALDVSGKGEPKASASVAVVASDGAVGAPTTVDVTSSAGTSLSVAPDGRALLAFVQDGRVSFIERAPGAGFAAPVRLARISDPAGGIAIARLHDTGAAAIAWMGRLLSEVRMATRPGLGGFRAPVTIAKGRKLPKGTDPFWYSPAFLSLLGGDAPMDLSSMFFLDDALVLTEDGRALLGTTTSRTPGAEIYVARLATVPLAGAAAVDAGAGGEFNVPMLPQPLVLADGTPALSWITDVEENTFTLHLATENATRPAPGPAPRVRFGAPVKRVLEYNEPLRIPVRCSRACTVRAQVVGNDGSDGLTSLPRAGSGQIRIYPGYEPIATRRRGSTVKVRMSYGSPGTVAPQTLTVTMRVRLADTPFPRIVGLKAVRRGERVRVTWRMEHAPRFAALIVSGSRTRDDRGNPHVLDAAIVERGRKSYRVSLPADRVRYVTLRPLDEARLPDRTTVKVTG